MGRIKTTEAAVMSQALYICFCENFALSSYTIGVQKCDKSNSMAIP